MKRITIEVSEEYADVFLFTFIGHNSLNTTNIHNDFERLSEENMKIVVDRLGNRHVMSNSAEWEETEEDGFIKCSCSNCGYVAHNDFMKMPIKFKYCPDCGCSMQEG